MNHSISSPIELRRICLVGVRGVGKTSIIKSIIHELPHIDYVVGSAVLRELAGADFARFDHLPPTTKRHYREAAIMWMVERQNREGRHILCDGHVSLLDESTGRVDPVFTSYDCVFFRELLHLEAPLDTILAQRQGDPSKKRSLERGVIAAEIAAERGTCLQLAEEYGMYLHHLPQNGPATALRLKEILS